MIIYQTNDNKNKSKDEYIEVNGIKFPKEITMDHVTAPCVVKDNEVRYEYDKETSISFNLQTFEYTAFTDGEIYGKIKIKPDVKKISLDTLSGFVQVLHGIWNDNVHEICYTKNTFVNNINRPHIVFHIFNIEHILLKDGSMIRSKTIRSKTPNISLPNGMYFSLNGITDLNEVIESIERNDFDLKKFFGNECTIVICGERIVIDTKKFSWYNEDFDFYVYETQHGYCLRSGNVDIYLVNNNGSLYGYIDDQRNNLKTRISEPLLHRIDNSISTKILQKFLDESDNHKMLLRLLEAKEKKDKQNTE
jgi:hypothetical protein